MDTLYPPWWHEGTAKPGEILTGTIRDQRDYTDNFRECPLYEVEVALPTSLTVGETVNGEWTVETRSFAEGDVVTVRASCHILMAELAVRDPVENGERVALAYFGKKDPTDQKSPHMFKVKKLDRVGRVNHAKYAQQLGEPAADPAIGSDVPTDSVVDREMTARVSGAPQLSGGQGAVDDDSIPFAPSVI